MLPNVQQMARVWSFLVCVLTLTTYWVPKYSFYLESEDIFATWGHFRWSLQIQRSASGLRHGFMIEVRICFRLGFCLRSWVKYYVFESSHKDTNVRMCVREREKHDLKIELHIDFHIELYLRELAPRLLFLVIGSHNKTSMLWYSGWFWYVVQCIFRLLACILTQSTKAISVSQCQVVLPVLLVRSSSVE